MLKGLRIVKKKNEVLCNVIYKNKFDVGDVKIIEKYVSQILNKIAHYRNIVVQYNERNMISFVANNKEISSLYFSEIKSCIF